MGTDSPTTLVATKLTAPAPPPRLVQRSRLDEVIDAAIGDPMVRMVLVSAPAGSGKSTLLASRLASGSTSWAWLHADVADHDPARFWAHVVAALGRAVPDIDAAVSPAIAGSAVDVRPLIERLVNHLTISDTPVALVVDDYHLIANPAIDDGIEQLIELAPDSFTLVLSTRVDPALRLSRLRVRGQLAELRTDDLRFVPAEASSLLHQRGPAPAPHHVTAVWERTEGWAAGLVLAGLSLAGSADADAFVAAFQGDDRLVADYLTDEFLASTSADDRDRLLRTSILDRLTGPLIDAVCDTDDGAVWLRDLAARNQLLIRLDRTGTWFRAHLLLRDLLRFEAESAPAIDLSDLHRRAGSWHLGAGDPERAIEHLLGADDRALAASVVGDHSVHLLDGGQLETVLGYLDRLGDDAVGTNPRCSLIRGWTDVITGRFAAAEAWLQRAQALDVDDGEAGLIAALGAMVHLANGDLTNALLVAETSPDPADATHAMILGAVRVWAGQFGPARDLLRRASELAEATGDRFATAGTPILQAVIEMESNEPAAAHRWAAQAIATQHDHRIGFPAHMALAHSIVGRTSQDPDEAVRSVGTGVELARRAPGNIVMAFALTCAGDVLDRRDDPDGATFLREARTIVDRSPDPGIVSTYLARIEARNGMSAPAPTATPTTMDLVEGLTDREQAVLRYLPSQLTQRAIAGELFVSLNTVRTHCKAIYRKLGVGDRKAAVQAARDHGLL